MNKKNKIILTFDLEEFDLPLEYNQPINKEEQLNVTTEGLITLLSILKENTIKATFFTTAYYAENNTNLIKKIVDEGHELASHMYYHSDYNEKHVLSSKQKLEEISNTKIYGIRSPRLKNLDKNMIKEAGYIYDSSLNPTYIPGRYNNLNKPRKPYIDKDTGLHIIPFSTSIFRIPLFWLSFKNLSPLIYLFLCKSALKKDGYIHLYFHPWEFSDLSGFNIPNMIKRNSGLKMTRRFRNLLQNLSKNDNEFFTLINFIKTLTT